MFYQCKVNDKNEVEELHKIVVHRFTVTDEDPVLHAAQPLWEWEQSEAGQFIMKNAYQQPEWTYQVDPLSFGYSFAIIAILEKKKLSEFYLKFKQ